MLLGFAAFAACTRSKKIAFALRDGWRMSANTAPVAPTGRAGMMALRFRPPQG